jgi:hypothetical protein
MWLWTSDSNPVAFMKLQNMIERDYAQDTKGNGGGMPNLFAVFQILTASRLTAALLTFQFLLW